MYAPGHRGCWTTCTYLVIEDVERVGDGSRLGLDIDAVVLVHGPLAEDDSVEGPVEADLDLHVRLAAHHLEAGEVGHVLGPLNVPEVHVVDGLWQSQGQAAQQQQDRLKIRKRHKAKKIAVLFEFVSLEAIILQTRYSMLWVKFYQ